MVSPSTLLSQHSAIQQLNETIQQFPQVHPITTDMKLTHKGVSRLVMIDRYSFKDTEKKTLQPDDFVVLTVKEDPKFPARGLGQIVSIDWSKKTAVVKIDEEYRSAIDNPEQAITGEITRPLSVIEKPLELFYEQIALRNATGLASVEETEEKESIGSKNFTINWYL